MSEIQITGFHNHWEQGRIQELSREGDFQKNFFFLGRPSRLSELSQSIKKTLF